MADSLYYMLDLSGKWRGGGVICENAKSSCNLFWTNIVINNKSDISIFGFNFLSQKVVKSICLIT